MNLVGTAGWSISKAHAGHFPSAGTALERYAAVFNCTEINSTFYRPHRADTWKRWADSVPMNFRFSVKAPKTITHEQRLVDCVVLLDAFFSALVPLGEKLGPILFQLPPSLMFDAVQADRFFQEVRDRYQGAIVIEPRHRSWALKEAVDLLQRHDITQAIADPPRMQTVCEDHTDLLYLRLHGAPKIYYSSYDADALERYRMKIDRAETVQSWCIFDNTAAGAALPNALDLQKRSPAVR